MNASEAAETILCKNTRQWSVTQETEAAAIIQSAIDSALAEKDAEIERLEQQLAVAVAALRELRDDQGHCDSVTPCGCCQFCIAAEALKKIGATDER